MLRDKLPPFESKPWTIILPMFICSSSIVVGTLCFVLHIAREAGKAIDGLSMISEIILCATATVNFIYNFIRVGNG